MFCAQGPPRLGRPLQYVLILYVLYDIMALLGGWGMPKRPGEMERIILKDGWVLTSQEGAHRHYKHPVKPGKVTIPFHAKELTKFVEHSILKQAGLK